MPLIKDQLGVSLPELTVALGLMGGISLVTMKMMDEQVGNEALLKSRAEVSKTVSIVKNALNSGKNCRDVLGGRQVTATVGSNNTVTSAGSISIQNITLKINRGGAAQNRELLAQNTYYNGFKVDTIRLVRPVGSPANTANLEVAFRVKSKNVKLWGAGAQDDPDDRILTERIPLIVNFDSTNTLTDCGPVVSDSNATAKEKFCATLGSSATWNATTQRCEFNDMRCPRGEVMVSMTSIGGGNCQPIHEQIDLNTLFSTQSCSWTGKVRIINDGGKLRVDCPP